MNTKKSKLQHFIVLKSNRVVDCLKDKDLCLAFQQAMDKWEHWCKKGERIEVMPMPDAKPAPVIIKATPAEVRSYAEEKQPRNFNTWPFYTSFEPATEK